MKELTNTDRLLLKKIVRKELNEISKSIESIEKQYPGVEGYVVDLKDSLEIYSDILKRLD